MGEEALEPRLSHWPTDYRQCHDWLYEFSKFRKHQLSSTVQTTVLQVDYMLIFQFRWCYKYFSALSQPWYPLYWKSVLEKLQDIPDLFSKAFPNWHPDGCSDTGVKHFRVKYFPFLYSLFNLTLYCRTTVGQENSKSFSHLTRTLIHFFSEKKNQPNH